VTTVESQVEMSAGKLAHGRRKGVRKPEARSAVTNGRSVLPNVDGRTLVARRYHDICSAIVVDQGGADRLSEARLQLIRRFAACACLAEQMESRLVNGETVDISEHALLTSSLVRVAQRIGINRVAKIVPALSDYLDAKAAEPEESGP
jgi:hypothetical protein